MQPPILTTPEIDALLHAGAPVAIGVSGGRDSDAAAFATNDHLDQLGHTGARVLIHADLGRVEWLESLPQCQRLADRLGMELITVRRAAGDMMDRWLQRWASNVERYINLKCVKLILPWSTPGMRFCTSEMKTTQICRALVRRFPGQAIINVAGMRREESPNRAKLPITRPQPLLLSKTHGTQGLDWLPILDWTRDEVNQLHTDRDFPLHIAYTTNSRVSCAFCIMGSQADIKASTNWPEHRDLYREMVALEINSAFAFQGGKWLGDVAPHLLNTGMRQMLVGAKERARRRDEAQREIPAHLLYTKAGWPTCLPLWHEAGIIANVRRAVADVMGFQVLYTDAESVMGRYVELMAERERRELAKA